MSISGNAVFLVLARSRDDLLEPPTSLPSNAAFLVLMAIGVLAVIFGPVKISRKTTDRTINTFVLFFIVLSVLGFIGVIWALMSR